MNVEKLKEILTKEGREELGIPVILPSLADSVFPIAQWSLEGKPEEGRQVWFCVGNSDAIRNQLGPFVRGRILPLHPELLPALFQRGPFDSLLLPNHGFFYSDPNLTLSPFWKERGSYIKLEEFHHDEYQLWSWKSNQKPLRLFGMDHHHAVLWDAKQILRPLGIHLDFHWLCDGRPPINEAIPSSIPSFQSSLDIYRPAPDKALSTEAKEFLTSKSYDGILTSHSLVSCHRLKDIGLPMVHINSTRFGNDWIQDTHKHSYLVESVKGLLQQQRLTLVHNNKGDAQYLHQYFPSLSPQQEVLIPSLCESHLRLRLKTPSTPKILIWDTRQVLLQQEGSPFMKQLYAALKQKHGDAIDSQAILMSEAQTYLPEGYLDSYTAVIHIPYNVSTMSMFQQIRANIPIWVPSKKFLAKLWADTNEPNELSWTVFAPGTETRASAMDSVRNPAVIEKWLASADFYTKDVLPLSLTFESLEDLSDRLFTTDYQTMIDECEREQQRHRENIFYAWEQVFQSFRAKA